ncbi:780_t:CDS:2, partial [Racocetra fulgida]
MYQSVCYCAHQVPISEILLSDDDSFEPFVEEKQMNNVENFFEDKYLDSDKDYFHEIVINGLNHNDTQIIPKFTQKYIITDLSEKCHKQISKNQLKYGALMGKTKKAIHYALQDKDNKIMQFIKEFNKRKEDQRVLAHIYNNLVT